MNQSKLLFRWWAGITIPFLYGFSLVAQPTDNPYRTRYPFSGPSHWTEVLKWNTVFDVTSFGVNGSDNNSDQVATEQAISAAAQAGGGVVFFPAGTYFFSDHLILKPGVVLRGVPSAVSEARDSAFAPLSKLEFPKFVFDTSANGGRGNDVRSAFKSITGEKGGKNMGVVNLDVNRARIEFHPNFDSLGMVTHAGGTSPNFQPRERNRNILVMGVRSNNAALPQHLGALGASVPDTSGPGKMRKWQIYYYAFAANIDVYVAENAIIANNRINDKPTDNFYMPNYKVRNRCTNCTNYRFVGQPGNAAWNSENYVRVLDSVHAYFDYSAHYGISLNRNKLVETPGGKRTIKPMIWYPEPEQEPSLYAKGLVIDDNWVYKTNRVGIWCAGQGLKVRRNVIRDNTINASTSWATPKTTWLDTRGMAINTNNSATFENRGIDFGGSDILIDSNDIQVSTHAFGESTFQTVDGEGIMDQGNGGGTQPNGIVITHNQVASNRDDCTNPTIGLYRTKEIHNVYYAHNEFTGNSRCMMIDANQTGTAFAMTNVRVENNRNIKSLIMRGSAGGYNALARNNQGTQGGGTMTLSCFVHHYDNMALSLVPNGCTPVDPNGLDSTQYPRIRIETPARDTLLTAPVTGFPLLVRVLQGTPDSVVFFRDAVFRIGAGTIAGNDAFISWNTPTQDGVSYVSAIAYFTSAGGLKLKTKTEPVAVRIDDGNPLTNNDEDLLTGQSGVLKTDPVQKLILFPNPSQSGIFVQLSSGEPLNSVRIRDLAGKTVWESRNEIGGFLSLIEVPSGVYSVEALTAVGPITARWIKL